MAEQREAKIDVTHRFDYGPTHDGRRNFADGSTVIITIPFTGDSEVFNVRPGVFTLNPTRARVSGHSLVLEVTGINHTSQQVRSEIDNSIAHIQESLRQLSRDADTLNSSLQSIARQSIEARRHKLLANQNLVASLGFQLKESSNSPLTYTAPDIRRKLTPIPPRASSAPYRPEPSLSTADYDHILQVIQNMAHVMERSPKAFAKMDEESLRTHFLVQLNGHYEGQACDSSRLSDCGGCRINWYLKGGPDGRKEAAEELF